MMMSCGAKPMLRGEQVVHALRNGDAAFVAVRLAFLVEAHHHGRCAQALHGAGMIEELLLPFLQADGVGDALALQAFQAGLDHLELAAVHHHRHTGDVRLRSDEVDEFAHGGHAIDEALVEVHVDDLRAVLHLLAGHAHGFLVVAVLDQSAEQGAAGDVGALTDVDEVATRENAERLEAGVGGDHGKMTYRAMNSIPQRVIPLKAKAALVHCTTSA
jgi:hypothetical protein